MKINLTFRQLEIFAALAETLSFSAAAQAVHLSQPALSAAIRKMEEAVNAPLFDRTTRSVALTPIGLELLKVTSRLLHDFDTSLADISDLVEGKKGNLRVSSVPSLAANFLPELLHIYQDRHPGVTIQVKDALAEAAIQALKMGEADVTLGPAKPGDPELVQEELFKDRLVVVCRRDHELGGRRQIEWPELQPYRLASLTSTSNVRRIMEAEYVQHGTDYQPAFEMEHASTLIGFIVHNLGIGILPASLIPLLNFKELHTLDLVSPDIHRSICVIYLKARSLTPASRRFVDYCKEHAKKYA